MLKQEQLKLEDTNMALFGTPLEKEVKKHAAEGEPAWKTAGQKSGLEGWRVENFQIKPWPKQRHGEFFSGDSYIFLWTYEVEHVKKYDVHFWLGRHTTLDQAGTAAYKTVELDDFLGDIPVQHRQTQHHETPAFKKLFPTGLKYLKGGIGSGFHHVTKAEYDHRLIHIQQTWTCDQHGKRHHVVLSNVEMITKSLNESDCFILDLGTKLFQFDGQHAGVSTKSTAASTSRAIADEREGQCHIEVVTSSDKDLDEFWAALGGKGPIADAGPPEPPTSEKKLFRISQSGVDCKVEEIPAKRESLVPNDVFIFDTGATCFVWVGKGASAEEKKYGLHYVHQYLKSNSKFEHTPIVRLVQGGENEEFLAAWK